MRFVIYILLAVLFLTMLTTCKSSKQGSRKEYRMKSAKPVAIEVDSSAMDSEYDGVADYVDYDTLQVAYSYKGSNGYGEWSATKEYYKGKKATIIDVSAVDETENKKNLIKGLIAYSVPDEMTVGENYDVKIRITKDSTQKKTLIVGDTKIPINDTTVNSTITIESIRVSSIMSASLSGDDNFKITPKSTEVQNIEEFGYTEWEWNVMPLKSGANELKLIIKVRIVSEDGEKSFKDIVVFEKNIATKSSICYSVKNLINKYWQWSLSTLVIPFIVWLYNRKKKKKEEE